MKIAALLALVALPLAAQVAPREFANSPARWLMTPEDAKAWRDVRTDDQAIDFIDLFWARRDPTPGTPPNENRLEFERRMVYADKNFGEGNVRGALTERGRVLILLGFPTNWTEEMKFTTRQAVKTTGIDIYDPTGGRQLAAKDTWMYSHEASVKFGVPKIEIVWIFDRVGDLVRRDPQRTDFTMALPGAIRSWIVSPDLKSVPEWASSRLSSVPAIATAAEPEVETTPEPPKKSHIIVDTPQPVAKPAGAGKLSLVADPAKLQPQSGSDPFAGIVSLNRFKRSQELGWAAEFCSGRILTDAPTVKVRVKLEGADGTIASDPEEFVPDSIKASPGCYLLRGSVPLADVEPGPHTLTVTITSPAGERSYNLTRDLQVE